MKMPTQRLITLEFTAYGVAFGLLVLVIAFFELPRLQTLRTTIDTDRGTITVLHDQSANLQNLKDQSSAITAAQSALEKETWLFVSEDQFFTQITTLAAAAHVTADDPKLADATPGINDVVRNVSLTIHGKSAAISDLLQRIQANVPLIAIESVSVTGTTDQVVTINASTVWK